MAEPERPTSRIVFVVLGGPLTVLLIAVVAFAITGTLARQTESTALAFTESITEVRIDISHGSVTLRGGDLRAVTGERILTRGIQTPTFTERVDGDVLIIESSCVPLGNTWCDVSYVLDIPRGATIKAETALGAIRASDLSGPIDLRSGTGTVSVDHASGPMRLESGAGSVTATGITSSSVTASSGAGSVDLAFASAPAQVRADAGAGSVDIELPRDQTTYRIVDPSGEDSNVRVAVATDPGSPNVLTVESGAGTVSVHYPEA